MIILKVPFNAGSLEKSDGQELAPDKVASHLSDFYFDEFGNLPVFDIRDVEIDNEDIEKSFENITKAVSELNGFAGIIGGDHTITYPCFKEWSKGKINPGLVVFDAHADVQDDFKVSHEDYLRNLINEGLKPANVVIVGLRNWTKEEIAYLKSHKIKYITMKDYSFDIKREVCDRVMSIAREFSDLYISIDIDVLDPAFAPGTGYAEPGGMSSRDLLYFVHRLKLLQNLRIVDVVEVNPKKDINDITSKMAAKLLVEIRK